MSGREVTLGDVFSARQRIASIARKTPLVHSPVLTEHAGATVYLKLENLQETGAFKIRGASNRFATLSDEERERGVITVSSGNHRRGVAYVAKQLGVAAVVCMVSPRNTVARELSFSKREGGP
jgi:threonine dehydratase